ncbi:MAG: archaemetzincin family Zn-dependent metalloprotease [Aigarchaeota archaeon]|nr:archaemetzincin family Zn-dependent metalloprotease [Candidatus Pelearchaeum maunauluense]
MRRGSMALIVEIFSEVEDEELIDTVSKGLTRAYNVKVVASHYRIGNAERAYNSRRRQYDASVLVNLFLNSVKLEELALIITDKDLYVDGLNFVFGYAPGRAGIISLARLDQRLYGLPPDRRLYLERTVKEAVHEIGHLLGLHHCTDRGCVMFFSNTIEDTDRKGSIPCEACMARIRV